MYIKGTRNINIFKLFIVINFLGHLFFNPVYGQYVPRPTEPFKIPEKIDYKNPSNWYAFGKINNPKKYIPNSFVDHIKVSERGAVFYVHPTTYRGKYWNPE